MNEARDIAAEAQYQVCINVQIMHIYSPLHRGAILNKTAFRVSAAPLTPTPPIVLPLGAWGGVAEDSKVDVVKEYSACLHCMSLPSLPIEKHRRVVMRIIKAE